MTPPSAPTPGFPPGRFRLDPNHPTALDAYLTRRGVLAPGEHVTSTGLAGAGNMNCTVRVSTNHRSIIVKQARPWVEKYPQFPAPWDRALHEIGFYQRTAHVPAIANAMPRLLHTDPEVRLLILSDLGTDGDYSDTYQRGSPFTHEEISGLAHWLGALHALPAPRDPTLAIRNLEMRALNHQHLFDIPLRPDNGLDLDAICPGLAAAAAPLRNDPRLRETMLGLGHDHYLTDGPALLHGDFFPGSMVRTPDGFRIIDPEFAFHGCPEFDLAILTAHLLLARQAETLRAALLTAYPSRQSLNLRLLRQLAGMELIRRLIGYAQLPLPPGLPHRATCLATARELVLDPDGTAAHVFLPPILP